MQTYAASRLVRAVRGCPGLASVMIVVAIQCHHASAQTTKDTRQFLAEYLHDVAIKLDVYLTFEADDTLANPLTRRLTDTVSDLKKPDSVEEFVEIMHHNFPGVLIIHGDSNPAILHLVDQSLAKRDNYPLEKKMQISFTGTASELIDAIHIRENSIERNLEVAIPGSGNFVRHQKSKVVVSANDTSVRQIMSDALFLSDCHRFLWIAETRLNASKMATSITLCVEQVSDEDKHTAAGLESEAYTFPADGQLAFDEKANKPETVLDALKFIDEGVQRNARNVRWAMLFLGKYKVERSIPLLIKDIDYEYTRGSPVEERFPAVKALMMMGEPGAQACLRSLPAETGDRRLELLCRVIIAIDGTPAIDAATEQMTDAHQRERIRATLLRLRA